MDASTWELFVGELKKVSYIAAPMVVVTVSQILPRVVSMMMVGQLGELALSGVAVATSLVNVTGLSLLFSSTCKKTHAPFAKDILATMREFTRFAIPSAVMVCLEWWSCEILVLLAGLLSNPQLETSVISICLMVASLHYFIPYSVGAAASTRVSNELGAGFPERAQASVWAASLLSTAEAIVACTFLLCCRNVLGYAFSNEEEVVDYLRDITPFVYLLLAMDCIQAVVSGVARGSGWQHLGAYVNLGAYCLVGQPMAVVLGFVLHLRGKGLWLGLNMGSIVQSMLLSLVTCSTNWRKQASMAQQRIFEGTIAADFEKF